MSDVLRDELARAMFEFERPGETYDPEDQWMGVEYARLADAIMPVVAAHDAQERNRIIEDIAVSALVDSDNFPDPRVANWFARWVRCWYGDMEDYEPSLSTVVAGEDNPSFVGIERRSS